MSKIAGRTRARVQAIQLLFQAQIQGLDVFDLLRDGTYALEDGPVDPFAEELARGVAVNRLAIERMLDNISTCWSYSRMPIVDRNILRLALYEMIEEDDITVAVAIDEAVELAKAFGTDESPRFINGVLGSVAADVNAGVDVYEKARQVLHSAAKARTDAALDETGEEDGTLGAPYDEAASADSADGEVSTTEDAME